MIKQCPGYTVSKRSFITLIDARELISVKRGVAIFSCKRLTGEYKWLKCKHINIDDIVLSWQRKITTIERRRSIARWTISFPLSRTIFDASSFYSNPTFLSHICEIMNHVCRILYTFSDIRIFSNHCRNVHCS